MNGLLVIQRAYLDNCTIGKAYYKGSFVFYTVERPWLSNRPNVSCVSPGEYALVTRISKRRGEVLSLSNPNLGVTTEGPSIRTQCDFHVANFPEQLLGCVGPGLKLHPEKWGVMDSGLAVAELQRIRPERVLFK